MLLTELLEQDDPQSPFKGEFGLAKRVAWSEPVALADVKAIGALADIPSSMPSSKASIVMTNVAGSPRTLYVAGVPIERVMFWVPHPGEHLGMGISILGYRGEVTLAVVADARMVPDPETITDRFNREFASMLSAARRARPGADRAAKAGVSAKPPAVKKAPAAKESGIVKKAAASPPRGSDRPPVRGRPRGAA